MKRLCRSGSIAGGRSKGLAIGAVVGVLAVLWLIFGRRQAPVPAPSGPDEAPVFRVAPPPVPGEPDDLSRLKGVGPVYQGRLADAGITRFEELAVADATVLAGRVEAPVSRVQGWIDEARRLVR